MTKEEKDKCVDGFLSTLKVVINPADNPRKPDDNGFPSHDYDVVLLKDGSSVIGTRFGTGSAILAKDITAKEIVRCLFDDALSYACNEDLGDFLDEFGYCEDGKLVKMGIKAWKDCKRTHDILVPVVMNNCSWNDGTKDDGDPFRYLADVVDRLNDDEFDEKTIPIDWDSYVEDFK